MAGKATPKPLDFRSDVFDMWDHMEWSYGRHKGYAIIGLWNQDSDSMRQVAFQWPHQKEELFKYLEESKNLKWTEIFYCPLLRQTSRRDLGNAAHRDILWADVDGGLKESTMETLRSWGARVVASGSAGSYHIYFKLTQNLNPDQHRNLETALRNMVGGDNKIADNDFLKLPGSWNYKNHPKFEATDKFLAGAVLSSVLDKGLVVSDIFNKLSVSLSRNIVEKVTAEYTKVKVPTKIPDYIRSLMAEKSEGDGSGRYRRCWNAVRTVAECTNSNGSQRFTLDECHAILDNYDPGVDKFGSRSGGWHAQINKIWQEWESERTLLTEEDAVDELFWDRRESLEHIHTCAMLKKVSPWAVLGVVLARVVTKIPYNVEFPGTSTKSLNLFVGLIGKSGAGKGAATTVAEQCVDVGFVPTVELGTGPGLIAAYKAKDKSGENEIWKRRDMLFTAYEIGSWAATIVKPEESLKYWLCQAWSGEDVGGQLKTKDLDIKLERGTYRMCVVMGVQPMMADPLIKNVDNGTPQRWLWLPAGRMSGKEKELPPPLIWPDPEWPITEKKWGRRTYVNYEIPFPESVEDEIDRWVDDRIEREAQELVVDEYAAHEMLLRRKVCVALMALDGRIEASEEDWELAGYVIAKSNARRSAVIRELREAQQEKSKFTAKMKGKEASIAEHAKKEHDEELKVERIAKNMLSKLPKEGMPLGKFKNKCAYRDREEYAEKAIKLLRSNGQIKIGWAKNEKGVEYKKVVKK